jgi:hypothetical protein
LVEIEITKNKTPKLPNVKEKRANAIHPFNSKLLSPAKGISCKTNQGRRYPAL